MKSRQVEPQNDTAAHTPTDSRRIIRSFPLLPSGSARATAPQRLCAARNHDHPAGPTATAATDATAALAPHLPQPARVGTRVAIHGTSDDDPSSTTSARYGSPQAYDDHQQRVALVPSGIRYSNGPTATTMRPCTLRQTLQYPPSSGYPPTGKNIWGTPIACDRLPLNLSPLLPKKIRFLWGRPVFSAAFPGRARTRKSPPRNSETRAVRDPIPAVSAAVRADAA
jgi:hypothetical protein